MQYMMFVATDPEAEAYDSAQDNIAEWFAYVTERGAHLHGDRLRPVEDATLVRMRNGEVLVTDGPFTESKEGSWATTSSRPPIWTSRSTSPPGIRWPDSDGSSFVRYGRSTSE